MKYSLFTIIANMAYTGCLKKTDTKKYIHYNIYLTRLILVSVRIRNYILMAHMIIRYRNDQLRPTKWHFKFINLTHQQHIKYSLLTRNFICIGFFFRHPVYIYNIYFYKFTLDVPSSMTSFFHLLIAVSKYIDFKCMVFI